MFRPHFPQCISFRNTSIIMEPEEAEGHWGRARDFPPSCISLGFTFPSLACFYPPHAPWTFCSPHESLQSSSHLLFPPSCCYRVSSSSPSDQLTNHPPALPSSTSSLCTLHQPCPAFVPSAPSPQRCLPYKHTMFSCFIHLLMSVSVWKSETKPF